MRNQKLFLLTLIIILSLGCSCTQNNNSKRNLKQNTIRVEDLIGAWGGDPLEENAYFGIYKDSIYYPDPDLWYRYVIKDDTLIIFKEENTQEKILIKNISNDTLTLEYLDLNIVEAYNKRH